MARMMCARISRGASRFRLVLLLLLTAIPGAGVQPAFAQTCEEAAWAPWNLQPRGRLLMAYDSAREVLVALTTEGSIYGQRAGTTWESTGTEPWTLRATGGPGPRNGSAMTYDAARGVCVLFGGNINGPDELSDTWTWDGEAWTLVATDGPEPRVGHAMAYDPDHQRVLLFGGEGISNTRLGDTWSWDGEAWTLLSTQGPSPRTWPSLTYDTARRRAVLYGGRFPIVTDTWEFDGTTWTQVAMTGPSPRDLPAMAYDAVRERTVLFGGQPPQGKLPSDTWEWDGVSWSLISPEGAPGARVSSAAAFHQGLGRVVMAGGVDARFGQVPPSGVVWSWDGADWARQWTEPLSPPAAAGPMVYDSDRQVSVANLFYERGSEQIRETWEWNGAEWTFRTATDVPGGPMVFDSARHYTLLTGIGTWRWDGEEWANISAFSPGGGAMAFDSDRNVAVLYAGGDNRETWEWDGGAWTLRSQFDPQDKFGPQARSDAAMYYDPDSQRTVMYGGNGRFFRVNETWAWDGTSWTFLGGGPPARMAASITYDSRRRVGVLFGGWMTVSTTYDDTWERDAAGMWRLVDEGVPSERLSAAMTYDAARDNIVLFGGIFGADDTWIRTVRTLKAGPMITSQPQSAAQPRGGGVSFHVGASGDGTLSYQWRKDGEPLVDTDRIHGTRTEVLFILNLDVQDDGVYDVLVSNACDSVTSEPATLKITDRCPGDFNTDGILNSQDFFDFLGAFFALLPDADFDDSGTVDTADFFAYLDAFFTDCD